MKELFQLCRCWKKKKMHVDQRSIMEIMLCDKYVMNEHSQNHANTYAITAFNYFNLL